MSRSESNARTPPGRRKAPPGKLDLFTGREPRNDPAPHLFQCWSRFQEAARTLVAALNGPDKAHVIAGIVAGDVKATLAVVDATIKAVERIKRECVKVQLQQGAVVKRERLK